MPPSDTTQADAAEALRDLASGLYTVGGAASLANKPLKLLKFQLKSVEALEKQRDALENGTTTVQKIAKVFEKVGPTKFVGKIVAKTAERTKDKLDTVEKSLDEITVVTDKIATVVEKTSDTLSKINKTTEKLGILADVYSRKIAVADQNLEAAEQLFDTGIPFFGSNQRTTTKMKLQIAIATEKNREAGQQIEDIAILVGTLVHNIQGINELVNYNGFEPIEKVLGFLRDIGEVLSPMFSPLTKVYDAVGPVLDALGSIFGFLLKPAEWALEAILDATGINDLMDKAADAILSFLPNLDLLDGLADRLELEILADLEAYLTDKIESPFAEIELLLNNPTFPSNISVPTTGDDALYGAMNDNGPLNVDAMEGDDILIGGEYDDTLRGGAGLDMLIGGGGDDVLDGGSNTADGPDVAIYDGNIDDYGIVSVLENGAASGVWYVADYRDSTLIAGTDTQINSGTDTLINIEVLFFKDEVLDLRDIDTFIRTRSADGDLARVTPTSSTLPQVNGIDQVTADRGNDRIIGNMGYDILVTGGGRDQLTSGTNGPLTIANQNAVGDYLDGGTGNDIYISGPGNGGLDFINDVSGIDTIDYKQSLYGLNVFLGSSDRESFYRPTSIVLDADPIGRIVPGNAVPVGVLRGIENIDGTNFDDIFIGNDAINKINGGSGNDQIRGLDGDDILLGGAGADTIVGDGGDDFMDGGTGSNTYIGGLGDDYITDLAGTSSTVKYAAITETAQYNVSVDFVDFHTTGFASFNELDMPGAIVVLPTDIPGQQQVSKYETSVVLGDRYGVDYLEGIERIVGSTGRDIIYTSRDISQIVYSGMGDDELYSSFGETQNRFYAGQGDDLFVSEASAEDTFFGGSGNDTVRVWGSNSVENDLLFGDDNRSAPLDGIDVLDFSQSDFSWHIYMNPGAANGNLTGKYSLSGILEENPLFIQPTLGVNGTVRKLPGVSVPGETYPGVLNSMRIADPNTENPGGVARNIGEFEHIIGSEQRDVISGGNPDAAILIEGLGGDDVLYASQLFSSTLQGGDGNDVLGTFNHTLGNDTPSEFYDAAKLARLDGGDGDDAFVAGDFREEITGGDGIDLLTYEVSTEGVEVNLETRQLDAGYATGDVLVGGIENLTGSQFDDELTGDAGSNDIVGWDGDDTIDGGAGSDALYGNDGDDEIYGGHGNDMLHGGNGGDLLDGGDGTDAASWNLYQNHPKGGVSRLTGDSLGITADLQTGLAGDDTLVNIENLVGGVGDDSLFGDALDNFLSGNDGDDSIDGRSGDDLLTGGKGDDTLLGGDGDDFFSGGAGINQIDGGAGTDILDYGISDYGVTVVMAGVGTRAAQVTGEVSLFVPVETYVWADSLTTMAGPTGLPGDIVETGTTETRYTYQVLDRGTDDPSDDGFIQEDPITPERIGQLNPLFADEVSDLDDVAYLPDSLLPEQEVASIDVYVTATDYFQDIEVIVGSQNNDFFLGNSENTVFYGAGGADTIDGGNGSDTSSYLYSEEAVTINLQDSIAGGGDAEGDALTGIENLIGTAFDDTLIGNDEANELKGAGGSDTISGGAGIDTVTYDVASTDVIVARTTTGVRIIVADGGTILTDDHVADDVEFFEFTDTTLSQSDLAGLIITGNSSSEELFGTAIADNLLARAGNDTVFARGGNDDVSGEEGRDSLLGEGGNDTLDGGVGNDTLLGGEDHDLLIGGAGLDRFEGGSGDDTFSLDRSDEITVEALDEGRDLVRSTASQVLQDNVEDLELEGVAALTGTGNSLDNALTGNDGANRLTGLGGDDTLGGGMGADTLVGGTGNDRYLLTDELDTIIEAAGEGADTIVAGFAVELANDLEGLELIGTADVSGTGNALDNSLMGNDGDNTLSGLVGDDLIIVSGGVDLLLGGEGQDTVSFDMDLADVTFDFDAPGFVLAETEFGMSRLEGFEVFQFNDQTLDFATLRDIVIPPQHVQLYAASYFENDYGIDISREGGGTQFLNIGPASQGSNRGNQFHFTTEFLDNGGRANYQGTNMLNVSRAIVGSVRVDFSGGNTTMVSIDRFDRPFLDLIDADWGYYETNIFSGDDRLIGSYFNDTLVGYVGDDTIFGGLGDKEKYDISDPSNYPNSIPSTIRQAGRVADRGNHFVFDGDDLLQGEGGDDLIDGGTGNDTLEGGIGNDQLWGGGTPTFARDAYDPTDPDSPPVIGDADLLDGGDGDDTLDGGSGNDTLIGGAGADVFVVDMGMGNDTIFDFNSAEDSISTSGLSTAEEAAMVDATDANGVRTLTLSDGSVLTILTAGVDLSGTNGNNTLVGGPSSDTLSGLDGNDSLFGAVGSDDLIGGAGNDTLNGGLGADSMVGGTGDDLYLVDDEHDVVTEAINEGDDTIDFSSAQASYVLADNVETLRVVAGVSALSVTGNSLDNLIDGGGVANTTIQSGFGDDTIRNAGVSNGGDGDDMLSGSTISTELHGERGEDTIIGGAAAEFISGGSNDDTVEGGAGNDTISGSTNDSSQTEDGGDDSLFGGAGDDMLVGGLLSSSANYNAFAIDGDDTLSGGSGDDTLIGGTGDDSLIGGSGSDVAIFNVASTSIMAGRAAGGGIVITSAEGVDIVASDIETVQFTDRSMSFAQLFALAPLVATTGDDNLAGTADADTIAGLAGNDTILGLAGDDNLSGDAGADSIEGGDGNDTVTGGDGADYVLLNRGADVFNDNGQAGPNGNDTVFAGFGADTIEGGNGDDEFHGEWDNDLIQGRLGNDLIYGGSGADTMFGGDGNDTVFGGDGRDFTQLGNGNDRFNDNGQGGVNGRDTVFAGEGNDVIDGGNGDDEFHGDGGNDQITGRLGNDLIFGGSGFDTTFAGDGADTVHGGDGRDLTYLGNGNDLFEDNGQGGANGRDTVFAGEGDDVINGGNGDDAFYGDGGNDQITGRLGNDLIYGGSGFDTTFAGDGADTVYGGDGRDLTQLGNGNDLFNDNGQGGANGRDTVFAGEGDDVINGGNGDDEFHGDGGNDQIYGRLGNDLIYGGSGADTTFAGDGADTVYGGDGRDRTDLGNGNDVFNDNGQGGVNGQDTVFGGDGDDTISGGNGNDQFFGDAGNDRILGRLGNDAIFGGDGFDYIEAGDGADTVFGGNGRDTILLGNGNDRYVDSAQGGVNGQDTVTGGTGADTFVFAAITGADVITDFAKGSDRLELDDALWGGGLTEAQVVSTYATDVGPNVLLDFGSGNTILLQGVGNLSGLASDIDIV